MRDWEVERIGCLRVGVGLELRLKKGGEGVGVGVPSWLIRQSGLSAEAISGDGATAQMYVKWESSGAMLMSSSDPRRLCKFLLENCIESGVVLHCPANPVGVDRGSNGKLTGVKAKSQDGTESTSTFIQSVCSINELNKVYSSMYIDSVGCQCMDTQAISNLVPIIKDENPNHSTSWSLDSVQKL